MQSMPEPFNDAQSVLNSNQQQRLNYRLHPVDCDPPLNLLTVAPALNQTMTTFGLSQSPSLISSFSARMPPPLASRRSPEPEPSETSSRTLLTKRQRIWQSCIIPLVLGCILFLIGICCRQLSMLLMNEATLLLFLVFMGTSIILMCTVVWLIKNHHLGDPSLTDYEPTGINNLFAISHRSERMSNRATQEANNNHNNPAVDSLGPPDYYSALANSQPVLVTSGGGDTNKGCPYYCGDESSTTHGLCYYCSIGGKASKSVDEPELVVVRLNTEGYNQRQKMGESSSNKTFMSHAGDEGSGSSSIRQKVPMDLDDELRPPNYNEAVARQNEIDRCRVIRGDDSLSCNNDNISNSNNNNNNKT